MASNHHSTNEAVTELRRHVDVFSGPVGDGALEPQSGSNLPSIIPEVRAGTGAGESPRGGPLLGSPAATGLSDAFPLSLSRGPAVFFLSLMTLFCLHILSVFQEIKLYRLS